MVDLSRYDCIDLDDNLHQNIDQSAIPYYIAHPYLRLEMSLKYLKNNNPLSCRLLDLGCGIGSHSILYAKMGYKVIGVDLSQRSIQAAKKIASKQTKEHVNVTFVCSDIVEYLKKIPESSFDVITMHGVLYYLDRELAIKEIRRVMKPNAVFCFIETNGSNIILNIYRKIKHFLTGYRDKHTVKHLISKKSF